jgi:hypothetical protein
VSNPPRPSCFLAEWYRPEVTSRTVDDITALLQTAAAARIAEGKQVRLLFTVGVPADEVLYAMFSAYSADIVVETCRLAGLPLERLSSNVALGSTFSPAQSPAAGHGGR